MAKNRYMSGGMGDFADHSPDGGREHRRGRAALTGAVGVLAHLPGMKVVVISNPYDYKGLLAASIQDDDPVIFIEHKEDSLSPTTGATPPLAQKFPEGRYLVPIGQAAVVRRGRDVTTATAVEIGQRILSAAEETGIRRNQR